MVNIAVVGVGYWGKNLARNFASTPNTNLTIICDNDLDLANEVANKHCKTATTTSNFSEVLANPNVEAIALATPIATHFDLASRALNAGKHVFVEKPLASTVHECDKLIDIADRNRLILMVGHVFEFNNAVHKIKDLIDEGEIGKVLYILGQRVNLGRIQTDLNALWSFAPHDVSIVNYWLGTEPIAVSARGFSFLTHGVEDVVFVTLEYPNEVAVNLCLSWLDPRKSRLMTIVGSSKMITYDDVSMDAKIAIHDKGVEGISEFLETPESYAQFQYKIRNGDVVLPALKFGEPLATECKHFIDSVRNGKAARTDGLSGRRVVKVLEAAQYSLKNEGKRIVLE